MDDLNSPEFSGSLQSLGDEAPKLQILVARHRPFFILVGVLVAQLLLLSLQITRNHNVRLIQVWAVAALDPFQRSLHGIVYASTRAWRTYRELWRAQKENQELNVQLVAARSQILELTERASEADRLRDLLNFKSRFSFQTIAAEVIATSPGEGSRAVFIDKGMDAGLTADLAVITPEGIVGKTIAVFPHTAQVLLIIDSESGVGCLLQRARVQGVLKGSGRALCRLHYVMNEEPVSAGDPVLTSGLDQIYPKGLPVGVVVQTGEGNIYKTIVVKPTAALDRLEAVLVVLKSTSRQQQALILPSHP